MSAGFQSLQVDPKRVLGLAVSAACAGVPAAQAEAVLEEIIVTSTKRSVNMQDVPLAVTAFSTEEIVRQGFKTFSDYAGQIPSLTLSERQPGATSVIMRGCAAQGLSFSDSATTSVYLDEQPITAGGYNPDPRLVDIQRVEALSGPQGTLFGDAAQCGTLRIITNKPDASQFGAWIDATGLQVDGGDAGYDVSGMVNFALIENKLALRLVGFLSEEPGYIDNVLSPSPGSEPSLGVDPAENFDNSANVASNVNTGKYYGGRAGLRWNMTQDWTVDVNGIYQKYDLEGFGDVDLNQQFYADTTTFPTLGKNEQIRFSQEDWEDEWYQASITLEGRMNFADLVVTGAYFNRDSQYNASSTAYLQAFQQTGDYFRQYYNPYMLIYDFGGDPRGSDFDGRSSENYTFEARLTSADTESRWGWLGGLFYNSREVKELFTSNVPGLWDPATGETNAGLYLAYAGYYYTGLISGASNNWFSGTYDSQLDQWAVFGEISFDITENFVVTAGGRWYDIENDYLVVQGALIGTDGGPPICATDYCYTGQNDVGSANEDGFVPKINLAYTWNDNLFYGTYSEGFRRGGANSARPQSVFGAPGQFPPPAGTLNEYDSDTVKNYEIGAKTEWFDNRVRFNITAYHMVWDDIQVQANDPQPGIFALGIVNLPEAEIDGVDAWFNWAATEAIDISATVGYNKAEISQTVDVGGVILEKGTQLPLMPDWKASANFQYTFGSELFSATPYLLFKYVYWGESTNSLGIESSSFIYPVRTQPDWQTLDFRTGLEGNKWSVSFYVDNMLDEYAKIFYNNRFAQQRLTVNQPRTYGLNVRFYFGQSNPAQ